MLALLLMIQSAATPIAPEAADLGLRLAHGGALASLLPLVTAKETEEMLAEHPDWADADKAAFRATARRVADTNGETLFRAIGDSYARALSVEDLRALVAFSEGDAARHWRAAEPAAIAEAMKAIGQFDYKGSVKQAFCAETGKGCPAKQ